MQKKKPIIFVFILTVLITSGYFIFFHKNRDEATTDSNLLVQDTEEVNSTSNVIEIPANDTQPNNVIEGNQDNNEVITTVTPDITPMISSVNEKEAVSDELDEAIIDKEAITNFINDNKERSEQRDRSEEQMESLTDSMDDDSNKNLDDDLNNLSEIIKVADMETDIEEALDKLGYQEPLVVIDDKIEIVVCSESLSEEQIEEITDIVVERTDFLPEAIDVKNVILKD